MGSFPAIGKQMLHPALRLLSILCLLSVSTQPMPGRGFCTSPQETAEAEAAADSPTEGVIDHSFVPETEMLDGLLQMLARFSTYLTADYQDCVAPNGIGEACGCFRGESTMAAGEAGVRTNADLSMVCAFLVRYAQPQGIVLPEGVTYATLDTMARRSLVFAYSTHKANRLKTCSGGDYWGSTSARDHVWESSLWAMSVAYSAYFQWDNLSDGQRRCVYNLLRAECNCLLERQVPTGYRGDTKAEENGWEADVLAATLGLFPHDALAAQWFEKMRLFAANAYSHPADAADTAVVDADYDDRTVADLHAGSNLYEDYTLQNHNLFHTSYQNVVMQELGEAALALRLFQGEEQKWHSRILMHNNRAVADSVLYWLALADGELAMPNGNDWSLFLFDQITSYSTLATFMRDPDALLLENLAYKQIRARQTTTPDGSWLLRPDVSARRMGVQAHRVMMTYLMHLVMPTADLQPTEWEDFRRAHSAARVFPCQNVVRAFSPQRFTTFSWSEGIRSYTGYFAANCPDRNKIVVPYRAHNTGNLLGWYEVKGRRTNARPVVAGRYRLEGDAYVMNGRLTCNDGALDTRFALYSTPHNALVYLDCVTANDDCTITAEKGGLLAISTDELTRLSRTLYFADSLNHADSLTADGQKTVCIESAWVNVDNALGIVTNGQAGTGRFAFGDRSESNSIMTSKLYSLYGSETRDVRQGERVDERSAVYYSMVSAPETEALAKRSVSLKSCLPSGWNGIIAADGAAYCMLVSNFCGGTDTVRISGLQLQGHAPVFGQRTQIADNRSSVTFESAPNTSVAWPVTILLQAADVTARMESETSVLVRPAGKKTKVRVTFLSADGPCPTGTEPATRQTITAQSVRLPKGQTTRLSLDSTGRIRTEPAGDLLP